MLYNLILNLIWEIGPREGPWDDAVVWTALSLDALLWAGLSFLVAQALWRSRSHR